MGAALLVIFLAAAGQASGLDMRLGDYPENTDAAGWKQWMVENCPTSSYGVYLDKDFSQNMDFDLKFVNAAQMRDVCPGVPGVIGCYSYNSDTIYLFDDGGAFMAACHELAHARGSYRHE